MRDIIGLDLVNRERFVAYGIHIEINPAIVVKDEITDGIGALYREGVIVPDIQEPWILGCEKRSGFVIRPQLEDNISARGMENGHQDIPYTRSWSRF